MAITRISGLRAIQPATITNAEQNFGTPSAATDVAIKSYVDTVAQGLDPKPSVRVATIAPLSPANTYSNGASGVGATLTGTGNGILTVDGVNTVLNNYILVKDEASGLKNGIYMVTTEGTAGVPYVLTRVVEMNTSTEFSGGYSYVEAGSLGTTSWVCTNSPAPTVGTTAITFTQSSGPGSYTASNGLTRTGTVFSIDTNITVDKTTVQTLTNKTLTAPALTGPTSDTLVLSSFLNEAKGADIASATTTDLGAATGNFVHVTGTTTITGLGTVQAGTRRVVKFTGALILTYNATSLIIPTAANITTAAGDTATFISLGSGNWICIGYQPASGAALIASPSSTYHRSTAVSGTQNGTNKTFTIANAVNAGSEQVFEDGILLLPGSGNDYAISGTTITYDAARPAPLAGTILRVYGVY